MLLIGWLVLIDNSEFCLFSLYGNYTLPGNWYYSSAHLQSSLPYYVNRMAQLWEVNTEDLVADPLR